MKYAVFAMGFAIAALAAAVVYGMMNPPAAKVALPAAMVSAPTSAPRTLELPGSNLEVQTSSGGYLVVEATLDGKKVIYLVNPTNLTLQGTIQAAQ